MHKTRIAYLFLSLLFVTPILNAKANIHLLTWEQLNSLKQEVRGEYLVNIGQVLGPLIKLKSESKKVSNIWTLLQNQAVATNRPEKCLIAGNISHVYTNSAGSKFCAKPKFPQGGDGITFCGKNYTCGDDLNLVPCNPLLYGFEDVSDPEDNRRVVETAYDSSGAPNLKLYFNSSGMKLGGTPMYQKVFCVNINEQNLEKACKDKSAQWGANPGAVNFANRSAQIKSGHSFIGRMYLDLVDKCPSADGRKQGLKAHWNKFVSDLNTLCPSSPTESDLCKSVKLQARVVTDKYYEMIGNDEETAIKFDGFRKVRQ